MLAPGRSPPSPPASPVAPPTRWSTITSSAPWRWSSLPFSRPAAPAIWAVGGQRRI